MRILPLVMLAMLGIASVCEAQGMGSERAKDVSIEFAIATGLAAEKENLIATFQPGAWNKEVGIWTVEPEESGWFIMIDTGGKVVGFANDIAESELFKRRGPITTRSISQDSDAERVSRQFLRATGLPLDGFNQMTVDKLADKPGADKDLNNTGYRWNLTWNKTVTGYPGSYDEMHLTVDVVTGKVLNFKGPDGTSYEPPATIVEKSRALQKIKELIQSEADKYRAEGNSSWADNLRWPGDEAVSADLRLGVVRCRGPVLGSLFGLQKAAQRKARLAWGLGFANVSIGVDAETCEPVFFAVVKSSGKRKNNESSKAAFGPTSLATTPPAHQADGSPLWLTGLGTTVTFLSLLGFRKWKAIRSPVK